MSCWVEGPRCNLFERKHARSKIHPYEVLDTEEKRWEEGLGTSAFWIGTKFLKTREEHEWKPQWMSDERRASFPSVDTGMFPHHC